MYLPFWKVMANNTTQDLEYGCLANTFERKYYRRGDALIKRSLRPSEFRVGFRSLRLKVR